MSAATGPLCVTCLKRVSARRVTRCIWCGRVVHPRCDCPLQARHKEALDMRKKAGAS